MELQHLVFTRMPGESYCRQLRSLLLCLCDVFWVLINSLAHWFYSTGTTKNAGNKLQILQMWKMNQPSGFIFSLLVQWSDSFLVNGNAFGVHESFIHLHTKMHLIYRHIHPTWRHATHSWTTTKHSVHSTVNRTIKILDNTMVFWFTVHFLI